MSEKHPPYDPEFFKAGLNAEELEYVTKEENRRGKITPEEIMREDEVLTLASLANLERMAGGALEIAVELGPKEFDWGKLKTPPPTNPSE